MKRTFITILIISIVISCKDYNKDNSGNEPEEKTEIPDSESEIEKAGPQIIEKDNLVSDWAKELEKISFDEKFQLKKEFVENRHIKGVTDTVKTFIYKETTITVYHTQGLYAVESADINDPEFSLNGPVQIGMKKNQLEKILDSKLNTQFIKVKNQVGTFEINFFIKNDILQRIKFHGYVD